MFTRPHFSIATFGLAATAVLVSISPLCGADKDNATEKQLRQARADLAQANAQIKALRNEVAQERDRIASLQAKLAKERNDTDDKVIRDLKAQLAMMNSAGLVHCVFLKLKSDEPSTALADMVADVHTMLTKIKTVRALWVGKPGETATPDFTKSDYSVALVLLFDSADGLKKYDNDPLHTRFVKKHIKNLEKPLVYDFDTKK
jgi:hypothetical protein